MSAEQTLRAKVLDAMLAGKLPRRRPSRTWGGRGSGASCVVCGELVKPEEVEFELEFAKADEGDKESCRLHLRCFSAWEVECEKLGFGRAS